MRMGLEAEYWVVDETGTLCDGRELAEVHEYITPEFVSSMIEIQTPPVDHEGELRCELQQILQTVLDEAEATGKRLVPLGTPLTPQTLPITTERGALMEKIYGEGIECAKNCAGTHIHFDKGNVTRQLNLLTALDPALALVSSSPYYMGERLANSSRAYAYRLKSGSHFARYRDLWEYTSSTEEWEQRIQERYEEFSTVAANRGITTDMFTKWFQPENAVLTPVRLRSQSPTVEWRAPDTALPSQILQLVEDIARLLRQTENKSIEIGDPGIKTDHISIPPFAELHQIIEEAINQGLHSVKVREYLDTMTFDSTRYQPITDQIYGAEKLHEDEAKKIRLEYAQKLHEDAKTLKSPSS